MEQLQHRRKGQKLRVSTPHPWAEDRKLYFMADVPHLIKNLKAALCRGDIKYKEMSFSIQPAVKALAEYDQSRDFKQAPKLQLSDIQAGHFAKMKVSGAIHLFSNSVACGISHMIDNGF